MLLNTSSSRKSAGGLPLAAHLSSLAGQQYDHSRTGQGSMDGRSFSICNFYPREE